ncbi:MAG: type II toxin-antitoxin system VapC family toxin [Corynebacterium variabile]|uniref:type II toxin-antitoxin system VapC family toxin n=1 Tax=Corynebacterium variabile TaxID=1727 RepID=UPI003FB8C212
MIVADAGVLVTALLDDDPDGATARRRLADDPIHAPDVVYPEFLSVVHRLVRSGQSTPERAEIAVGLLHQFPLNSAQHLPLLPRAWELRGNITPYDAMYVALAESLDCVLLTADARLSRAPGVHCPFEVIISG